MRTFGSNTNDLETASSQARRSSRRSEMTKDEFLARVEKAGALASPEEAERRSRVVLSALTHLIAASAPRRHFLSQLPGFLKAELLAEVPASQLMNRDAFIRHIGAGLDVHAGEAERALGAVYGVLTEAISAGEISEFERQLPPEIGVFLRKFRA
jgi:uncharacterized protein (DUF2267 family)